MIPKDKQAAQLLEGKELIGGWKVIKKINKESYSTGGVYSCCYEVEKGPQKGFLKAFDYSGAEKIGMNYVDQLRDILNAFTVEKEILEKCKLHGCRNVIRLLDTGATEIEKAEKYPRVDYLILEYAEKGDVRTMLANRSATIEWKIRSLHQLAKGLSQIHKISIAHQDIKPSNIVSFKNDLIKITDFGSAVSLAAETSEIPSHLKKDFSGSWEYAPPELLYGQIDSNPITRRIGCDLYLLGSMVAFYFTNMSMTALIKANMEESLCWTSGKTYGNYVQLKAYLIMAYEKALEDIRRSVNDDNIRDQVVLIVKYLCHPDPNFRGHQKNISESGDNYSLERFMSMFDRLIIYYKTRKLG